MAKRSMGPTGENSGLDSPARIARRANSRAEISRPLQHIEPQLLSMAWSAEGDERRCRREEAMTDTKLVSEDRRKLIKAAVAGAGATALFGGFGFDPLISAAMAEAAGKSPKPLKAAFSNAGL
jgi:hypothetical protein